jgi:hypothetical protein
MAYSLAFWICMLGFLGTGLAQAFFVSRMRRQLAHFGPATDGGAADGKLGTLELLRLHESEFPSDATRRLYSVSRGVQLVVAFAGLVFIIVAQFQPNNLLHLIPIGR